MQIHKLWQDAQQHIERFYSTPLFAISRPFPFHPSRLLAAVTLAATGSALIVGVSQVSGRATTPSDNNPSVTTSTNVPGAQSNASNQPSTGQGPMDDTNSGSNPSTSISTHIESDTTNGLTHTSMTVNGKPVPVPANGDVSQQITTPNGHTSLNISSVSSGTSQNSSTTSLHVSVNGSSTASEEDSNN